jgi:hypothetical protein
MARSIPKLLQVAPHDQSVRPIARSAWWLREALQCAVELELYTIPPYLCALWSIKALNPKDYLVQSLRAIVGQEMKHLGNACNLMTAFGWTPNLNRRPAPPRYPGRLPGDVHPGLRVALQPLSKDLVGTVFMQVEFPSPAAVTAYGEQVYPTIGAFYEAIAEVIADKTIPIIGGPQLSGGEGVDLTEVTTYDQALTAVTTIRTEGEGAHGSPFAQDGGLAHYYRFAELFWERKIIPCGDGGWGFCGNKIVFPNASGVYPMAPVPARGYPRVSTAVAFNRKYTRVLDDLQAAWSSATGGQQYLDHAVGIMTEPGSTGLAGLARTLMDTPRPDGKGNFGPDFHYLSGCRWF